MTTKALERGEELERWELFGAWLRGERKARRLTQQECADAAGLSLKQWQRLESGESGTKYDQIPSIAAAIGADKADAYREAGFLPPKEIRGTEADASFFQEMIEAKPGAIEQIIRQLAEMHNDIRELKERVPPKE